MDENAPVATPFDESYPDKFARLAEALAIGDALEARCLVGLIANPGALDQTKRQASSLRRWTAVFAWDSYTCRYCERRTIAPPVLRVVSIVFPSVFRFQANWKTSETDAAYFILSTSADQVVPVTRGGTDDPTNLVTACWMCNGMKSNYLLSELPRWSLKPAAGTAWRGLTEHLDRMMSYAGLDKEPYLKRWNDAIANPEAI